MAEAGRASGDGALRDESLKKIARRLLEEQLDELTELAVRSLRADEPDYAASQVSRADLSRSMRRTLGLALARIAGEPIPEELRTAASEVGRVRAQQGLPLAALLHSYRLDLRILWEAIIREGRAAGVAGDEGFLESSILVWEAVEANTAEVVDAYRQAYEDMSKSIDVLRRQAFERLVMAGETDTAAAREASRRLDLPAEAWFLVVVSDEVPVDHSLVVACGARLSSRGLSSYFGWIGDELLGVVLLAGRRPEDVAPYLETLSPWKTGAAVVHGLREVPRGVRLARAVIGSLVEPGVQLLEFDWPLVLISANEELARALAEQVLGPLLALPENDRAAVIETLEAYLAGSGSLAEVARLTLRHRNTVRNRLRTVERVTGLSLARPQDIATIAMAMAWRRGPVARSARS